MSPIQEFISSDQALQTLNPVSEVTDLNLPRFGKDWRMRWFYLENGSLLHRIAAITWQDDDKINGHGATACGKFGFMWMPGIGGRMGAKRCTRCCEEVGVQQGNGAPFNQGIDA